MSILDKRDWVLFDDKGVIAQGPEDDVRSEFETTTEFTGDLVLAQIREFRR